MYDVFSLDKQYPFVSEHFFFMELLKSCFVVGNELVHKLLQILLVTWFKGLGREGRSVKA